MHYTFALFFLFQLGLGMTLPAKHSSRSRSTSTSTGQSSDCTVTDLSQLPTCKKSCSTITIGDLYVPAGKTLDLTQIKDGTKIVFTGKVTFGYKEWLGPMVTVSGNSINIQGKPGAVFDVNGQRWWDGLGGKSTGKVKPRFFSVYSLTNSIISGLKIKNTPVQAFYLFNANTVTLTDITIDSKDGDILGRAFNTDGFGVGHSNGIHFDNVKVYNQDDCLAVCSGTNITFSNSYCYGGHGISIGSVGNKSFNDVDTVTITDCTVVNSANGIRIKTVAGAKGSVRNVSYTNIQVQNVTNAITIRQDYSTATGSYSGTPTTGVPITKLTVENVKGTVRKNGIGININCAKGSCSDWTWQNNVILDKASNPAKNLIFNAPI